MGICQHSNLCTQSVINRLVSHNLDYEKVTLIMTSVFVFVLDCYKEKIQLNDDAGGKNK